mgnify:CR=1 FL=1
MTDFDAYDVSVQERASRVWHQLDQDRRWNVGYIVTPNEPNWGWLQLWEEANPRPPYGEGFEDWHKLYELEADRVWIAACFPQYRVLDWDNEDIEVARELVARHTCSVCGRNDDPGCVYNC